MDYSTIIVAAFAFAGTVVGGIISARKRDTETSLKLQGLTERFDRLETKVDKHNCFMERMSVAETEIKNIKEHICNGNS